jgi:hypothetical protein
LDDATSCRKRAKEAADIAEKMTNPQDKAVWLKVATEWLKLADAAEAQRKSEDLTVIRKALDLAPASSHDFIKDNGGVLCRGQTSQARCDRRAPA